MRIRTRIVAKFVSAICPKSAIELVFAFAFVDRNRMPKIQLWPLIATRSLEARMQPSHSKIFRVFVLLTNQGKVL